METCTASTVRDTVWNSLIKESIQKWKTTLNFQYCDCYKNNYDEIHFKLKTLECNFRKNLRSEVKIIALAMKLIPDRYTLTTGYAK
jgi:hypothetical protein